MTIKIEAAYHEAGHVVAAKRSRFHQVIGGIDLAQYGAGNTDVSLSGSKLANAGKPAGESAKMDKEVTRDLAITLMAGYQAELIAAEKDNKLRPNRECADIDYKILSNALSKAGLSQKTDQAEEAAKNLLIRDWKHVDRIAKAALERGVLSFGELYDLIEDM